jgi:hypothetical protein
MVKKELGKITSVRLGKGGYDDACFGITFQLRFGGYATTDLKGQWANYKEGSSYSKEKWEQGYLETMLFIHKIMSEAKVDDLNKLVNTPIEVTSEGMKMVSWRVLTEVL